MSNSIDRKTAEAARRRAIKLDALVGMPVYSPALETERRASVKVWNEFCAQETARLEAKPLRIHPTVVLFGG